MPASYNFMKINAELSQRGETTSFSQRGREACSLVPPTSSQAWSSLDRVVGVFELKQWYEKWSGDTQDESNDT
jgi:hypothetical protein